MIRRSLRIGIRLGLLTGLAFVLFKIVQSRRAPRVLREADDDGWGPPADGRSPSSPEPVLVRPTMPERSVGDRDRTRPAEVAPLDAVAGPVVEVDDPVAQAPQAQPGSAPAAAPAAKKRAAPAKATKKAARKATKKAAKATKRATKKATKKATARATPAAKARARESEAGAGWVEPVEGTCPSTHPVKAKMASGIFHLPGMAAYNRTSADRCYSDAEAAGRDGLRPAKR